MLTRSAFRLAILLGISAAIAVPQDAPSAVTTKESFQIGGQLESVLPELAQKLGRPIGFVVDSLKTKPCEINPVSVNPAALDQALDSLMAQCPSYRWGKEGASVFLLPRRPLKLPLDLQVRSFDIGNGTREQAQELVMQLPELREWMKLNGVLPFDVESPTPARKSAQAQLSVTLSEAKLHEVLDAVARSSGKMFWRIVWFDHDRYMGIYF
jgi:hypothetical protein